MRRQVRRVESKDARPWGGGSPIDFLEQQRARYRADTREAIYNLIQAAAAVVKIMKKRPRLLKALLRHSFFKPMRGNHPKSAARAVMQFALFATNDNQRAQANRYARALDHFLDIGMPVSGIAERLARHGGVRAALDETKLELWGVPVEPSENPASKLVVSTAAAPLLDEAKVDSVSVDVVKQKDIDDNDDNDDDDVVTIEHGSSGRLLAGVRNDDDSVELVVTCSASDCKRILMAERATLVVDVKQVEGWQPVELNRILNAK